RARGRAPDAAIRAGPRAAGVAQAGSGPGTGSPDLATVGSRRRGGPQSALPDRAAGRAGAREYLAVQRHRAGRAGRRHRRRRLPPRPHAPAARPPLTLEDRAHLSFLSFFSSLVILPSGSSTTSTSFFSAVTRRTSKA